MIRFRHISWIALTLLLVSTAVAQHDLGRRSFDVEWVDGTPRVAFSATELLDGAARRELRSGLQARFVVNVQAYRGSASSPLATRQYACAITYDLWQDAFVLRMGRRSSVVAELDAAITRCLNPHHLQVGESSDYRSVEGEEVYFAVRAEFNPISERRCRDLLRSSSADAPVGPLVINIVRREICQAERAINFRSAPVSVP